jgi:hypothetical protein
MPQQMPGFPTPPKAGTRQLDVGGLCRTTPATAKAQARNATRALPRKLCTCIVKGRAGLIWMMTSVALGRLCRVASGPGLEPLLLRGRAGLIWVTASWAGYAGWQVGRFGAPSRLAGSFLPETPPES